MMMMAEEAEFFEVDSNGSVRRIAVLHQDATGGAGGPGLIWLPGFKSVMVSSKAQALGEWAQARGLALTRFDYSGHGQSTGEFEDGTIGDWLAETEAVFDAVTSGPQILVGSSMGGWIALALLRRLIETDPAKARRIQALVLIAPAWDMSEELIWNVAPKAVRDELRRTGRYLRPSAYDERPYPITMRLIEEGRAHLIKPKPFDPGRPVKIIHGRLDADVPFSHSAALQRLLPGNRVDITEIPDGEHRLSRPQDLAVIFEIIDGLIGGSDDAPAARRGS